MVKKTYVGPYRRKGKLVNRRGYKRKYRGKGKKLIIGKTPIKLYPIRDEFGQVRGFSKKRM